MTSELCACGHPAKTHGLGRESCAECSCRRFRTERPAIPLRGVYDLGVARRALRARTGKPLLDPARRDSGG